MVTFAWCVSCSALLDLEILQYLSFIGIPKSNSLSHDPFLTHTYARADHAFFLLPKTLATYTTGKKAPLFAQARSHYIVFIDSGEYDIEKVQDI